MKKFITAVAMLASSITAAEAVPTFTDEEVTWLAKNVYFEARNQPHAGRMAVALVTLNRVFDPRFPNTIRGVVTQGVHRKSWRSEEMIPVRNRCHFSWYCDGKADKVHDWASFNTIKESVSFLLTSPLVWDITDGATHYHADYVSPEWAETKTKTVEIEDHIFYRWD